MTRPPEFPAPGFTEMTLLDPFERLLGPIYQSGEALNRRYQFKVDDRHVNGRMVMHGGMMMTLADATLGALAAELAEGISTVTLSMQTQFLAPVPLGHVVEIKPELTRRTRSVLFIRGDLIMDGKIVFIATSMWKLLGQSYGQTWSPPVPPP